MIQGSLTGTATMPIAKAIIYRQCAVQEAGVSGKPKDPPPVYGCREWKALCGTDVDDQMPNHEFIDGEYAFVFDTPVDKRKIGRPFETTRKWMYGLRPVRFLGLPYGKHIIWIISKRISQRFDVTVYIGLLGHEMCKITLLCTKILKNRSDDV